MSRAHAPLSGRAPAIYGEAMRRALMLLGIAGCFSPDGAVDTGTDTGTGAAMSSSGGPTPTSTGGADSESGATDTSGTSGTSSSTGAASTTGETTGETTDETTGPPPAGCGEYTPGLDLQVCTATYLGGAGVDVAGAVDIAADGTIVVGGGFPGHDFGVAPMVLGEGDGRVVRLAADGRSVLSVTRLAGPVRDLEVDLGTGNIAVIGGFGAALLGPDGDGPVWSDPALTGRRIALGDDGTLAALVGTTVSVRDAVGGVVAFEVATVEIAEAVDVAVHAPSKSVLVAGTRSAAAAVAPCVVHTVPFIHRYDYAGALQWAVYDWDAAKIADSADCTPSRANAIAVGRDGKLYYAGEADGEVSVHSKDPRDLAVPAAGNVATGPYDTLDNFEPPVTVGYYARFDVVSGQHQGGQFMLARRTQNNPPAKAKAGTAVPIQISALADGTMVIAGVSSYALASRDARTIDGAPVGTYVGVEPFVSIVAADFATRRSWAPFTRTAGGRAHGLAVGADVAAALFAQGAEQLALGTLVTVDAVQADPGSLDGEVHLAVFPVPTAG